LSVSATDTHRAIDAVWRIESAKLIAGLARMVRDVGIAEDLAQDALLVALEQWPQSGIPDNPGAWLMATAKHRAIDRLRRNQLLNRKHEEFGYELEAHQFAAREAAVAEIDAALDDHVGDDLLRLVFVACHPVLAMDGRVALTLRMLGGLTTGEIARAYLVPEPTIAQRIVRAKRTLSDAKVPFEVPRGGDMAARLSSVLQVIYLIFNEGYAASSGDRLVRDDLCAEAIRLGRVLADLMKDEPEVLGLLALMLLVESRRAARVGADGQLVLLAHQDRRAWNHALIAEGQAIVRHCLRRNRPGAYQIQAAINAVHSDAPTAAATDWRQILQLYDQLLIVQPGPIVALNRAVAVAELQGPEAALRLVDALDADRHHLDRYYLLHAVRADLLRRLGRNQEAAAAYERAVACSANTTEREFLRSKWALVDAGL
jgi:RNA polymerase sigma factor (sigma-70 family)